MKNQNTDDLFLSRETPPVWLIACAIAIVICFIVAAGTIHTRANEPEFPACEAEVNNGAPAPTGTIKPSPEPVEPKEEVPEWKSLGTYELTAYCSCAKCCGKWGQNRPTDEAGNPIVYTATGAVAEAGTTIAVDPRVIPYGSSVKINDHIYIAQDTGGGIKGARIDIYFDDHQDALIFGRQKAEVFIMEE